MVIKIFYIVIAIFCVTMVILSVQSPYLSDDFKRDLSIANMEMNNIIDYEVSQSVTGKFTSDKGTRYNDRDEFENFYGQIFEKDTNHTLKSNKARYKKDIVTFSGKATYTNTDDLNYISEEIIYNLKTKVAQSDKPFVMTQNNDKITGKNLKHILATKQTFAKGVHAWIQTKENKKTD